MAKSSSTLRAAVHNTFSLCAAILSEHQLCYIMATSDTLLRATRTSTTTLAPPPLPQQLAIH
eukprot:6694-Heterococcus_DN1.PRE.2